MIKGREEGEFPGQQPASLQTFRFQHSLVSVVLPVCTFKLRKLASIDTVSDLINRLGREGYSSKRFYFFFFMR